MPITMINASPTSRPIFVSRVMFHPSCELRVASKTRRRCIYSQRATRDSQLPLLCDAQFRRTGPWVGGDLGFGGRDGLIRQDVEDPGLLRRPKRLLDRTIFRRLKRDDRQPPAGGEESRGVVKQRR